MVMALQIGQLVHNGQQKRWLRNTCPKAACVPAGKVPRALPAVGSKAKNINRPNARAGLALAFRHCTGSVCSQQRQSRGRARRVAPAEAVMKLHHLCHQNALYVGLLGWPAHVLDRQSAGRRKHWAAAVAACRPVCGGGRMLLLHEQLLVLLLLPLLLVLPFLVLLLLLLLLLPLLLLPLLLPRGLAAMHNEHAVLAGVQQVGHHRVDCVAVHRPRRLRRRARYERSERLRASEAEWQGAGACVGQERGSAGSS